MDRDLQSELISAYLDGELTPAERMDAERLLESTPELREELNDFARLSDLLRALPREAAPAELASAIRREAERKSLLGAEPAAPRRSYLRELVVAVSAMAATVLGMLLLPQETLRRDTVASRAPLGKVALEAEHPAWAKDETKSEVLIASSTANEASPAAAAPSLKPATAQLAMRAVAPGAPPPPAPTHDADIAAALVDGVELAQDSVPIGDVVPYFQNGVGVVVVTVVDVESAGDRLAVLLEQNGLAMLPEEHAKRSKERHARDAADGKPESSATRTLDRDQQLMLVYVDASQETVTQVLSEMSAEKLFSHAKLQPPVGSPELTDFTAVPAETPQVEAADKPLADEELAEQVLTNNAVVAAQNYRSRQQLTEGLSREAALRGSTGKDGRGADRRQADYQAKAMSKIARNRGEGNARPDDSPVDANQAQNMLGVAALKQNGAALMKLDANSGEVLGNTVMLEQRKLVEKGRAFANEKQKAGVEAKKTDHLAEREEQGDAAPAEPTVRLLLVLQAPGAAASAPTP